MVPRENAVAGSSNGSFTSDEVFNSYGIYIPAGEVIAATVSCSLVSVIGRNDLQHVGDSHSSSESPTESDLHLNFADSDLIICAVYVPMYIFDINNGRSGHQFEGSVRFRMGFGLFITYLHGEFSVTLDRFIAISFLYWYMYVSWLTRRCISSVLFASWIKAIFLTRVEFANRHTAVQFLLHRGSDHPHRCIQHGYVPRCHAGARPRKSPLNIPRNAWSSSKGCYYRSGNIAVLLGTDRDLTRMVPPTSTNFKRHIKLTLALTSLSTATDPFIFCWRLSDFRSALCTCLRKTRNMILRRAI